MSAADAGGADVARSGTEGHEPLLVPLSMALRHLFDGPADRILWRGAASLEPAGAASDGAGNAHAFDPAAARSWLVVVERKEQLGPERFATLERTLRNRPSSLVVVVDAGSVDRPGEGPPSPGRSSVALARQLDCDHLGPVPARDLSALLEALAGIKGVDRPAVLSVSADAHDRAAADESPEPSTTVPALLQPDRRMGSLASRLLARLAAADPRVVLVASGAEEEYRQSWTSLGERVFTVDGDWPSALAWSAEAAAGGTRPFVLITLEEAENALATIRQRIARPGAAVTLVVEMTPPGGEPERPSSGSLIALRKLPNVALLYPRDALELEQMFAWSAAQASPAVIALPELLEAARVGSAAPIERGRAEWLARGSDVALVACGPLVQVAAVAAEALAERNLSATIINARFAAPLDREAISQAVAGALAAVVLTDDERPGGFGSWVLEELLTLGLSQPISVVPIDRARGESLEAACRECARAVVERVAWLSAPVVSSLTIAAPVRELRAPVAAPMPQKWLNFSLRCPDSLARERAQVYGRQLSADALRWVSEYRKVGSRDLYLWKWCMHGATITTLPGVSPELCAHVNDTKLLSIILCVLMDDVADQRGDSRLLDALLEMACSGKPGSWKDLSEVEKEHAEVTRALWPEYWSRVAGYPCFAANEAMLRFDLLQTFNMMRYSHLVNERPYLLNMVEHDLYTPHNMMMTSFAVLDLMCSPGFAQSDLAALREMNWHAQCMGRIGNLLSTWRRELAARDFTSGVFARAMMQGDVSLGELEHGDLARLEEIICSRGHEAYFFHQWLEQRERCHDSAGRIRSLDLRPVLEGHDRFFAAYLGSQGLL